MTQRVVLDTADGQTSHQPELLQTDDLWICGQML